jgi:hypothetical protein
MHMDYGNFKQTNEYQHLLTLLVCDVPENACIKHASKHLPRCISHAPGQNKTIFLRKATNLAPGADSLLFSSPRYKIQQIIFIYLHSVSDSSSWKAYEPDIDLIPRNVRRN